MSERQINRTVQDMLYLTACALHSAAPGEGRLAGMDLTALLRLAKYQSMTSIICMALESCGGFQGVDPTLVKQWQDEKNKAIRKNLLLEAECGEILRYMESRGIWYMPLKGSVLKELYPGYGMRQMADYDILFDPAAREQMQAYMAGRGYEAESVGRGNHDAYHKPPVYNFELHRALFGTANPVWADYYRDVKERLLRDEGNRYGYHFSDEDFYIYIMTHACKHYQAGGTGLRSLTDCYVYCWNKGDTLDWAYIRGELAALGVAEFEQQCREVGKLLFSDPSPDAVERLNGEQRETLSYLIGSGTYGTVKNRVENQLRALQQDGKPVSRRTRWRYCWRRLVPDREWFRSNEPFCSRHGWAIPLFVVYRVFRGVILRGGQSWREFRMVLKTKN